MGLVVLVDGFNLYHGLHDKFGHRLLWLDLVTLAASLRPRSKVERVEYFTAPVLDDAEAASRQGRYQQALMAAHPDTVHITQGRYQRVDRMCRHCGKPWRRYEEKETDVNIATTLLIAAAEQQTDSVLIVSADSDLLPAVRAARQLAPDMFIAAAFPPKRFSNEIKRELPRSFSIGTSKITNSQLPDEVIAEDGRTYRRPDKWRG